MHIDFGVEGDSALFQLVWGRVLGVGRVVGLFAFEAATRAWGDDERRAGFEASETMATTKRLAKAFTLEQKTVYPARVYLACAGKKSTARGGGGGDCTRLRLGPREFQRVD